jgi:hypothetical protein
MLFSQRKGIKSNQLPIQVNDMDDGLRNGLWSILYTQLWEPYASDIASDSVLYARVFVPLWHNYFKYPIDTIPAHYDGVIESLRERFFGAPWNEAYDFVEFTVKQCCQIKPQLTAQLNSVLQRDNSAYRFVGTELVEMTDATELRSIEEALDATQPFHGVNMHLQTAV